MKNDSKTLNEVLHYLDDMVKVMTEEEIEELKDCVTLHRYKKNDVFYKEGDVPQMLHCLLSGKIKVYKDGAGGRTQVIRLVKPVEYFGYRAYMANQNYVTAAAAFENCMVCLIPLDILSKWMHTNNKLAMYFVKQLAIELGASDQRTVSLTQKHIRGRLAEALLFLKESYGFEEDSTTLSIHLSREDLANLSNMTTSNAIRTLSSFSAERVIAIDGRKIQILDEDNLKRISKFG